jgi:hypothetical protein
MRILIATLIALGALSTGLPVLASSDMSCDQRLVPASASYTDCASSALLAPGNDTRVNLAWLMMDAHGGRRPPAAQPADPAQRPSPPVPFGWTDVYLRFQAPAGSGESSPRMWSSGEGTTCVSNDQGQTDFLEALQAERKLAEGERASLSTARKAMTCPHDEGAVAPAGMAVSSEAARAFADYLRAIAAFYAGGHDPAPFQALAGSKQPWVREASRYMVGRAWALVAQASGFGTYGEVDHERMDDAALAKAGTALNAYLKTYPNGRYAASAHGLVRRVHWLAGDTDALAAAYGRQIDQRDPALRNVHEVDLAQEIDAKLPADAYVAKDAHPVLVAVDALRRMRKTSDDNARITRKEIEALRPRFKGREALHGYLLAAHAFFVDGAPHRVLELIPAETPSRSMDTVDFSRQTLRALALGALKDKEARAALVALFPQAQGVYQRQTLELALAMHDERNGDIARVFAPDSLVVDPALREQLLIHVAGPDLLRARADDAKASKRERALALYVLLYKQLTRGRYAEFLKDVKRLPAKIDSASGRYDKLEEMTALADFRWQGAREGHACPPLQQIATTLAAEAGSRKASLCLGEFLRLNGYDRVESWSFAVDKDELGGTPGQFPGRALPRQRIYQTIIDDAAASADERAYALFRAVNCYAPAGDNDCGGDDVPVATRKAWFNQLKSRYPNSPWAAQLRYYW